MTVDIIKSRLFVVDAFTSRKHKNLKGNPAGVLITSQPLSDEKAIEIAKKLSLPALAMISDQELFNAARYPSTDTDLPIQWIGPTGFFLPLCGHATMATSLLLFTFFPDLQDIKFIARRSGRKLTARRTDSGAAIGFPAAPKIAGLSLSTEEDINRVLSDASSLRTGDIKFLGESRSNDPSQTNLLVEIDSNVNLQAMQIEPERLLQLPYRGFWLTTPGPPDDAEIDMQTRVFFPNVGILEDHVCGSAHTLFGPYWAMKRNLTDAGQVAKLTSRQVSPRGGLVGLEWDGKWAEDGGICYLIGEGVSEC